MHANAHDEHMHRQLTHTMDILQQKLSGSSRDFTFCVSCKKSVSTKDSLEFIASRSFAATAYGEAGRSNPATTVGLSVDYLISPLGWETVELVGKMLQFVTFAPALNLPNPGIWSPTNCIFVRVTFEGG